MCSATLSVLSTFSSLGHLVRNYPDDEEKEEAEEEEEEEEEKEEDPRDSSPWQIGWYHLFPGQGLRVGLPSHIIMKRSSPFSWQKQYTSAGFRSGYFSCFDFFNL